MRINVRLFILTFGPARSSSREYTSLFIKDPRTDKCKRPFSAKPSLILIAGWFTVHLSLFFASRKAVLFRLLFLFLSVNECRVRKIKRLACKFWQSGKVRSNGWCSTLFRLSAFERVFERNTRNVFRENKLLTHRAAGAASDWWRIVKERRTGNRAAAVHVGLWQIFYLLNRSSAQTNIQI